ncbi:MAG: thio(seleno)oxazole modification radical SAM maturase SbtM [Syntrophobacteraceae bacterium]
MNGSKRDTLDAVYPVSRARVDSEIWDHFLESRAATSGPEDLAGLLSLHAAQFDFPAFLPDLARIEWAMHEVRCSNTLPVLPEARIVLNPALRLLRLSWRHLTGLVSDGADGCFPNPEEGEEFVLLWRNIQSGEVRLRPASCEDLLALKVIVEEIEPQKAAAEGSVSIYAIEAAIDRAVGEGLLIRPPSRIRRETSSISPECADDEALSASVFTLQWHITQACDLHCRHCYDRSDRVLLDPSKAVAILDDFYRFCRDRNVRGQVSFTGGNPFLHPNFLDLYRAAAERRFGLAILGNPASRELIEALIAIEHPVFYQVSLEGLRTHNDWSRGPGHFDRVLGFLDVLRDLGVYSMVMLTLTRDNMAQVLPLADLLRGRTDLFTFNRLSKVGEGANLQLPSKRDYMEFLTAYTKAAGDNPVISLKDNLINIVLHQKGMELFGGCTGYGCGAAFNFLTVLPDGEVHACRKFPSPIGNVTENSLAEIYDSGKARAYRAGCQACRSCAIRRVCGGCLAISHGSGGNPFEDMDPYCFIGDPSSGPARAGTTR